MSVHGVWYIIISLNIWTRIINTRFDRENHSRTATDVRNSWNITCKCLATAEMVLNKRSIIADCCCPTFFKWGWYCWYGVKRTGAVNNVTVVTESLERDRQWYFCTGWLGSVPNERCIAGSLVTAAWQLITNFTRVLCHDPRWPGRWHVDVKRQGTEKLVTLFVWKIKMITYGECVLHNSLFIFVNSQVVISNDDLRLGWKNKRIITTLLLLFQLRYLFYFFVNI